MPIMRFLKADKNKYIALYPNYDGIGTYTIDEIYEYVTLSKTQKKKLEFLSHEEDEVVSLRIDKEQGAKLIHSTN